VWSQRNIERVEQLTEAGLMKAEGLAAFGQSFSATQERATESQSSLRLIPLIPSAPCCCTAPRNQRVATDRHAQPQWLLNRAHLLGAALHCVPAEDEQSDNNF
jgi:hypothetical protein